MDFWIDMGMAALMRVLKDRRELRKYRALFLKLAAAIFAAYENDAGFEAEVKAKLGKA